MGKGYTNYMCKKPFHPGSKANIKRAWMAEQKTENDKKKQEELKIQYDKEQELYHNRALLSKESKDKLGLNFMYEAPPGAQKEHQKEDNEPEYKFEWQRKYNAPREDFARGNAEIRDQPFGIQVRNVRCIKCHKWGHINTDKECPLFHKASDALDESSCMTPMELMRRMKEEEGLALKQTILGHRVDPNVANQQMLPSEDEEDVEMQFLKTLSKKQKEKLLKKLEKLEKKSMKTNNGKSEKKSKKKKKRRSPSTSSSDSDDYRRKKHGEKTGNRRRTRHDTSESDDDSNGSSVEWTEKQSVVPTHHNSKDRKEKDRHHVRESVGGHYDKRRDPSSSSSSQDPVKKRGRSRSPLRK